MAKKRKRSGVGALAKMAAGAGLVAAAGAAAVLADGKTRKKLEAKAKKTAGQLRSDPRVKGIGNDTADLLSRVGEAIRNFFK